MAVNSLTIIKKRSILDVAAALDLPLETKVLDKEIFPQSNITELNSDITFIVFFSVRRSLYSEREYTPTHTHKNNRATLKRQMGQKNKETTTTLPLSIPLTATSSTTPTRTTTATATTSTNYPQPNITRLNSSITFIVFYSHEKPLQ